MTDENYRNKGLNKFLMEKVLEIWKGKYDIIYLFANDTVLDFYPKFGFTPVNEYQTIIKNTNRQNEHSARKMNIDNATDFDLLNRLSQEAKPLYKLSIVNNIGLIMFYCLGLELFKDNQYYIEELDCVVIAEYEESNLIIYEILSSKNIDINDVITTLILDNTENIILRFSPILQKDDYCLTQYKE